MTTIRMLIGWIRTMAKTPPLHVRLRPDIRAGLEQAANADLRSLSGFVERVLADFLAERGYITQPFDEHRRRDGRSVASQPVSA